MYKEAFGLDPSIEQFSINRFNKIANQGIEEKHRFLIRPVLYNTNFVPLRTSSENFVSNPEFGRRRLQFTKKPKRSTAHP